MGRDVEGGEEKWDEVVHLPAWRVFLREHVGIVLAIRRDGYTARIESISWDLGTSDFHLV